MTYEIVNEHIEEGWDCSHLGRVGGSIKQKLCAILKFSNSVWNQVRQVCNYFCYRCRCTLQYLTQYTYLYQWQCYVITVGFFFQQFYGSTCPFSISSLEYKSFLGSISYIQVCIYSRIIPLCISINLACEGPSWLASLADNNYEAMKYSLIK